jgi:hypothetical protein
MSNAGKYIRRDQWKKINANRQRLQRARDIDTSFLGFQDQREALPVFTSRHFRPFEKIDGQRRWLLLPEFVSLVRKKSAQIGPAMYCRACGQDIPEGAPRIYFKFRWSSNDTKESSGCVHRAHDCVGFTVTEV